jgi:transcriptional regulator with XRE-family HTH domain
LIERLIQQGLRQTEIAKVMGVTKSFISRVAAGQRALTLEHLARLEEKLKKPVALFLIESMARPDEPPQLAHERERIRQLMNRPEVVENDRALTPAEEKEADALHQGIKGDLAAIRSSVRPTKSRVIKLLQDEAGLSIAKARQVYEVQARFAAAHRAPLFGT